MKDNSKIEAPEIVPSEEITKLINQARKKLEAKSAQISVPDTSEEESTSLDDKDTCMKDLLKEKPSQAKAILRKKLIDTKETVEKEFDKKIKNMPDLLAQKGIESLFSLLNTLNIVLISPFDETIKVVLISYNKIVRLIRVLFDKDNSKENKEIAKKSLLAHLKTIPYISDIIALIILIEDIKPTISTLENAKDADEKQYDDLITKYKQSEELLKDPYFNTSKIAQVILDSIKILLPLLALLGAAFNSSKEFDKAVSKKTENNEENDNSLPITKIQNGEQPENTECIVYYAKNNMHNFSYVYKNSATETASNTNSTSQSKSSNELETEQQDECYESLLDYKNICIVDRSGVIGEEELDSVLSPEKFIYELDVKDDNYSLNISNNQEFTIGEELGKLNNLPFKANVDGIVEKIEDNKIFCKLTDKSTDELLENINNLSNSDMSSMRSNIQGMVDKFSDLSYAETVIREYIAYTIIPQIPLHNNINGILNTTSKDDIYKSCENKIEDAIDTHQENIKTLGGKEHAQSMAQQNKIIELKDEIIQEKRRFYDKIFDFWENDIINNESFCTGNEKDYRLYSNYLNLYYKIEYDADNKYSIELQKILTDFISTRSTLESSSLDDAIKELNNLCNDILKEKWAEKQPYIKSQYGYTNANKITNNFNYYKAFEKMFQTNYYTVNNSSDSDIELNSEYKKMYDFLVGIMDANDDETTPITEITADDVNSLLNGGTSENKDVDTSKAKIRQKLKDICNRYTIIKNISDYKKVNADIIKNKKVDSKNDLIKQTSYEYEVLEKYYYKVKEIYLNNKNLYDNDAFDNFKEAAIEQKPLVYYKNEKYAHYYITTESYNIEDLYDSENMAKLKELAEFNSSPYTTVDTNDIRYWLLYCAQATLMHCALPMYWGCGFLAAGAPIPMPVIYVPIYYLKGSVSMLFGLGICGIAIWPMIVCFNFTIETKCILQPVNMIIDKIRQNSNIILSKGMNNLNKSIKKQLDKVEENEKGVDEEIRQLEIDILNKKEEINIGNGIIKLRIAEKKKEKEKKEEK